MLKKLLQKLQSTIMGGAIIIGSASIISRILGLLRDRLLASSFGAGDVLDTYYAAFKIPDFIFNILVLGALSSSFVPIFLEYWHKDKNKKEAWRVANSVFNIIMVGIILAAVLFFIFAPYLMFVIAPGFDIDKKEVTAMLTRIMLISVLFFGMSNVVSGMLNSLKKFLAFSLAPIMYNLGIIFGIVVLVPYMDVYGLAVGVIIGAFLHFLIQLPAAFQAGWRYRWVFDYTHQGVRRIGRLMIPRMFGLGINQINQIIIIIIGSTLATGSVAVFSLANNLQFFPISVFGVSLAITSFPVFSQAFCEKDTAKFRNCFSTTVRRILFFIIPVSILILLLRAEIVRLVLGAGSFDWEDTVLTADTFGFFSLSLFAQSLIPVLARAFFARQDTKTPVVTSFISMILNIVLAYLLSFKFGVMGLALAFSLASIINMILLMVILRVRIGELDDYRIIHSTLKIIAASLFMGIVTQVMKYFIGSVVDMQTFIGVLIKAGGSIIFAGLVYLLIALKFNFSEVEIVKEWLNKIRKQVFFGK